MSVKKIRLIINLAAIITLLVSLIGYHIITVQAFILAIAIKFIPGFFLPKCQLKNQ